MIWTKISGVDFDAYYNFADGVWRAQRSLIRIVTSSPNQLVKIRFDRVGLRIPFEFSAETNTNKEYILDVTDYMLTKDIGSSGTIEIIKEGFPEQINTINFSVLGNISPTQLVIPNNGEISEFVPIFAPNYYLKGLFGKNTQFSYWNKSGSQFNVGLCDVMCDVLYVYYPFGVIEVNREGTIDGFINDFSRVVKVRDLECNKNYCLVQWVDSLGLVKRHTFELVNVERSVADSIGLDNIFGGFTTIKGARKSARLRLPKLSPYDYWYYSDLITSSDVRVAINEDDVDFGEDTRVNVITSNIQTPSRIEIKDFEVDIILKDYAIV